LIKLIDGDLLENISQLAQKSRLSRRLFWPRKATGSPLLGDGEFLTPGHALEERRKVRFGFKRPNRFHKPSPIQIQPAPTSAHESAHFD
jgi:hypothetical protein